MSRISDLKKKYPNDDLAIDTLSVRDPSGNNKYLGWVTKIASDSSSYWGGVPTFDNYLARNLMTLVIRFHNVLPYIKDGSEKDIYSYKSYYALEYRIDIAEKDKKHKEEENSVKKIYEDENLSVVIPLTHSASCKYGSTTRWCTASTDNPNHFKHYTNYGNLFYVLFKKNISHDVYRDGKTNFMKIAVLYDKERTTKYQYFDQTDRQHNIEDMNEALSGYKYSSWSEIFYERYSCDWLISISKRGDKKIFKSWQKAVEVIKNDPKINISELVATMPKATLGNVSLYKKEQPKTTPKNTKKSNEVDLVDAFNHMKLKVLWNHFFKKNEL
jgi:hypothetical protein